MSPTRLSLALIAACIAGPVLAAPTPQTYNIDGTGATAATTTTGGVGTNNGTSWNDTASSAYGTNGTNYGNTYSWAGSSSAPAVTMSAWGSTSIGGTISKAWIGNYGAGTGFGITSQSTGELNAANDPDASSPNYQHAIDNVSSYESMLFSFASAVTLNSVSIGFKGSDADATVFVYNGSGDPSASMAGKTYAQLLASGWVLAGNLLNMSTSGPNAFTNTSGVTSSKYWMVGAFMSSAGGVNNVANDTTNDAFKLTGLNVTPAITIPEPDSVALFGVAALGLFLARRKTRKA